MKKFLEQHNLSKYQQFFQEHGLNVAGLTNIKDLDLRKMGIASVCFLTFLFFSLFFILAQI